MTVNWEVGGKAYSIPEEKLRELFPEPLGLNRVREIFNGPNEKGSSSWRTRFALVIAEVVVEKLALGIDEKVFKTEAGPAYAEALVTILENLNPPLLKRDNQDNAI